MHARCQDQFALSALLMSLFRREIVLLALFRLEPLRLVRHSSPLVYIVNVSGVPKVGRTEVKDVFAFRPVLWVCIDICSWSLSGNDIVMFICAS
jgi:hypothetical protein